MSGLLADYPTLATHPSYHDQHPTSADPARLSITVSVVDTMHGWPADGVGVQLSRKVDGSWQAQAHGRTDETGILAVRPAEPASCGLYRVELDADSYFASLGIAAFYPTVTVLFRVLDPDDACHISILITPQSHLTYRSG
jgi:5-hydroxyisourate hydrolase-like protein (transthyretin family)